MSQPGSDIPPGRTLSNDPWSIEPAARVALLEQHRDSQQVWLPILTKLVEPPPLDADFPAFLLDTPHFAELRSAIGNARSQLELDTGTADKLQRFVDCYRSYLHADAAR